MSWIFKLLMSCFLPISASKAAFRCEDLLLNEKSRADYRNQYAKTKQSMEELEIVDKGPVGKGAFGARWVEFSNSTWGVWKPNDPQYNSAKHEVAAARIDHHLGLDLVPITVGKNLNGFEGSVQLEVKNLKKLQMPFTPEELGFFDYLIENRDRSGQNLLQTESGQLIAIDHGISFGVNGNWKHDNGFNYFNKNVLLLSTFISERKKMEYNLTSAKGSQRQSLENEIRTSKLLEAKLLQSIQAFMPAETAVKRLENTTKEAWENLLGDTITPEELNSLIERQSRLVTAIRAAEQKLGKEILYVDGPYSPVIGTPLPPPKSNAQKLNEFKNRRNFDY